MLCRYYLKIGVSEIGDNLDGCLDCTEMICNSDDIEVSYKRTSPFGGVVRKCTSSIVFCNEAKDLIYQEYLNNYLNAKAAFALYTINNDWTYSKEYECPLDFSSLQYEGNTIEMNTIDQSVAAIIKANKSVKYEFPVSDIKDEKQLYYDRLALTNVFNFQLIGDTESNKISLGCIKSWYKQNKPIPEVYKHLFLPVYMTSSEDLTNYISVYDQHCNINENPYLEYVDPITTLDLTGSGLLKNSAGIQKIACADREKFDEIDILYLKLKLSLKCHLLRLPNAGQSKYQFKMNNYIMINIVKGLVQSDGYYFIRFGSIKVDLREINNAYINIKDYEINLGLMKGDIISVIATFPYLYRYGEIDDEHKYDDEYIEFYSKASQTVDMTVIESNIELKYSGTLNPLYIDVIKPQILLNKILSKLHISGTIDSIENSRINNSVIIASESIRSISNAKLYTSFSDFCKWMEAVFGYVYEIENGIIVFKHRNSLFSSEIVADLTGHIDDILINLDSSNIYSSVRVGYNKQDYDSINGRDEFHFTNEYTTQIALTENKLELISPYRADCYGIEFLCQKRSEKTKDDESDNDVFFVDTNEEENFYILNRLPTSGVLSPDTIFNQSYRPSNIVMENKKYIGVFTPKLYFSSSEGNSDVSVNGVFESSDIELNQSLATVGKLKISSDIQKLPEGSFIGLFTFVLNGYRYTFYLDSVDFRYQREQQSTIEGIIKSIEKL